MSDIKPVFYVDPCTLRCRTMDDISDEDTLYYRRGDKVAEEDIALYSEDAIEALQKEVVHWKANHTDLKERLHVATHRLDLPSDRLPLFDKMKAEIADVQKENEALSTNIELLNTQILCLDSIVNRQAKRIAELELMNSEVK